MKDLMAPFPGWPQVGGGATDDDDLPASSAEADRAAREAERDAPVLTDEGGGADDQADDRADEGGEPADEGTSPEEAAPAEEDESDLVDEGTSPEPEPTETSDDDWTPEEKAVRAQYKEDQRELVRALLSTKSHSLGQHQTIEELKTKLAEAQGRKPGRDEGTSPEDATPAPTAPRPDEPPELQKARRDLEAMANDFDEGLKAITERETGIVASRRDIIKLEGRIEGLEEELKDANVDEVRKDQIRAALPTLTNRKDSIENKITRLETERTRLLIENKDTHRDYHNLKGRVDAHLETLRASDRAKAKERETFNEQEKVERRNLDTAVAATIAELKVPKEDRKRFTEALLIAANGHPGTIKDLKSFFVDYGRRHLQVFGGSRALGAASYAEQKKRDAAQPAPRGAKANAADKNERPLTSKEADRIARETSKRIPLT